ncbi:IS5 family transposase [Thauera linaloolentis]|uniref:IS4 family transposase n=1 Tax=Thauera linaloolentis (strain DSM 12138 / JCM 21573 / CCUG 41526 / CIP 105981 / IAM 15112 / NBRC 102519 / 47Lol) TaxID=1123367 RepID=N6Z401_THAL4|nr:IS5 family transposase [Thauera linaloolentis]ENO89148.1 IS4 family transposase [Thauera linaloolentis 47Lol = DSM 12138]MCM8567323.1 IS5 family transposase [Thauera linaloolentis]
MRGEVDPPSSMFHSFSVESRIPADHPFRRVKQLADSALSAISAELDGLYAKGGRPSIPPERLLKAQLLIAFYSVRSDRQFCEQLDYNLLFRWFLDLDLESGGLDQSNFSRLRERLVETDIARRFFDEVVRLARKDKLLSSDHFTVDGPLIDAWASFKSFKRKDDDEPPKSGGDGTGMVDFKGEKRSNATHRSTTDPDAKLMRKGNGQPAKLSYGRHALMENRSGLCIDLLITDATMAEHKAARQLLTRARRRRIHPKTLGVDKGYHVKDFVQHLREHKIKPHIARIEGRKTPGLDGRTTCTEGYKVSQRKRKRVEEIFGWLKTVGGMRKTRFIGQARTQIAAYLSAAAYNLLRIAKLQDAGRTA